MNSNFEYKIISKTEDPDGNFISLVMKLSSMTVNLITLYGPNNDHPDFFQCIQDTIEQTTTDYNIICGDFNLVLNPDMDTHNYNAINNPRARQKVLTIMKNYDLCDVFRELHQNKKRFTWRRRNPVKQARLDFFLVSTSILDIVKNCDINISYRSDHSTIELQLLLNNFIQGKGIWKFNNSLLENPNYLNLVNNIIDEEKLQYARPGYHPEYIKQNTDYEMTTDHDLFLETLLLRIRGETTKFATNEKKRMEATEQQLVKDIETIEESVSDFSTDLLSELENLRSIKMKGKIVRSRLEWLKQGEKPSRFFMNLENKNFVEKTNKKVKLRNGSCVTEQEDVLHHIKQYYETLFKSRDDNLETTAFKNFDIVGENKYFDIGGPLTVDEVSSTLKRIKSHKIPGIDGITVAFLKVFWLKLKHIVTNALNCCYNKGSLSTSL